MWRFLGPRRGVAAHFLAPGALHVYAAIMDSDPTPAAGSQRGARPASGTADVAPRSAPRIHGWRYTFSSLAVPDFRYHWLSVVLIMGSGYMQMIARGYLVYQLTSSGAVLGLVVGASGLPALALGPIGGALADRLDRKRIIQVCQVLTAGATLFIAVSITTNTITWLHLLGSALVHGTVMSFMWPARQSIIPQLVGRKKISNAMALNSTATSLTALPGPAIAGVLYAKLGPDGVYYIITAMTVAAVVLTAAIRAPAGGAERARGDVLTDIKAGASYVRGNRLLLVLLVMALASVLFVHPTMFLMPVIVVEVFHRESQAFGLLISMLGLGALAGALGFASLGQWNRGLLLIVGSFVSGAALLLMGSTRLYYAAAGMMLFLGVGDSARRVVIQSLLVEKSEERYRGRVVSLYIMLQGLLPVGVLSGGVAMDLVGTQATVTALGAGMLITGAVVFLTQKGLVRTQ